MANMPNDRQQMPPWGYDPRYYQRRGVDLSNGYIPATLVVSGLVFVAWATNYATGSINSIVSSQKDIKAEIAHYIGRSDERVKRIEETIKRVGAYNLTKAEHALWCARTETINRHWKCGDMATRSTSYDPASGDERGLAPIWGGISEPAGPVARDWDANTRAVK